MSLVVRLNPRLAGRCAARDERGVALSAQLSVVVVALLLITGLVVDGGRQTQADVRCTRVAAQAARAGADAASVAQASGLAVDDGAVVAAASQVLAAYPDVRGQADWDGAGVTARCETTTSTVFLSLVGLRELRGRGEARAQVRASGDR